MAPARLSYYYYRFVGDLTPASTTQSGKSSECRIAKRVTHNRSARPVETGSVLSVWRAKPQTCYLLQVCVVVLVAEACKERRSTGSAWSNVNVSSAGGGRSSSPTSWTHSGKVETRWGVRWVAPLRFRVSVFGRHSFGGKLPRRPGISGTDFCRRFSVVVGEGVVELKRAHGRTWIRTLCVCNLCHTETVWAE